MDPRFKDHWLIGRADEKEIRTQLKQDLETHFKLIKGTKLRKG